MDGIAKYSVKPNLSRVLVPQTIGLFAIGGVFYALLTFNLSLAFGGVSAITNYMIVIGLLVLLITETIVNYVKNNNIKYDFLNNSLIFNSYGKRESMLYNEMAGISFERNLLDKLFRTVTIVISPEFKIKFINDENKVHFNIQKLINVFENGG